LTPSRAPASLNPMSRDDDIVMTREQWQNHRGRDVLEDGSPAVLRLDESGAMALVPVVLLDFSEYERTGRLPYVNPREADVIEIRRARPGRNPV
jgi:hypothetical protein